MAELVKICPTSEVADNSVKSFEVGNNVIAVYNLVAVHASRRVASQRSSA